MRAPRAGLAALCAIWLLCWAVSGVQSRQIAEPEPAGAAALGALVFGSAGGAEPDHEAQPRLFKQEVPAEGQQAAGEQKEAAGEDKTIAQVRPCMPQYVQHPTWSALQPAMRLPGPGRGSRRGRPLLPRCPFEPTALPGRCPAADAG